MDLSGVSKLFISQTENAYTQFLKNRIPFSLVKLNISRLNEPAEAQGQLEKVIDDNFRRTSDIVMGGTHSYRILMKNTCFDFAMAAATRLAAKLYHLNHSYLASEGKPFLDASFDILGCVKENKDIQRVFFDLHGPHSRDSGEDELPAKIRLYSEYEKFAVNKNNHIRPTIDLTV